MRLFLKFGLVQRKERWGLTIRGWALLCAVLLLGGGLAARKTDSFLSVTCRVQADTLVVEGWLPDYALEQAVSEFSNGHYRLLIACGGPLPKGSYLSDYKTDAECAAAILRKMGVGPEHLVLVSAPRTRKDRSYAVALAVKDWLTANNSAVHAVNVVSLGPHARRSRLLFQKALGDDVAVGVIAPPDDDYDHHYWWTSSAGVRTVLGEAIAYVYARFFFHPSE